MAKHQSPKCHMRTTIFWIFLGPCSGYIYSTAGYWGCPFLSLAIAPIHFGLWLLPLQNFLCFDFARPSNFPWVHLSVAAISFPVLIGQVPSLSTRGCLLSVSILLFPWLYLSPSLSFHHMLMSYGILCTSGSCGLLLIGGEQPALWLSIRPFEGWLCLFWGKSSWHNRCW